MSPHCLKSFEVWVSFGKSQSSWWSAKQCDLAPLTSVNSWLCPLLTLPSLATFALAELYVRNAPPSGSLLTQFPYFISASVQMLPFQGSLLNHSVYQRSLPAPLSLQPMAHGCSGKWSTVGSGLGEWEHSGFFCVCVCLLTSVKWMLLPWPILSHQSNENCLGKILKM